jgi:ribonuclease HI
MSAEASEPTSIAHVQVYTDGGCKPNPGPGGWGAIIRFGNHEWLLSGNDPHTTNNRMEMQAAVAALGLLEGAVGRCQVELYTDSEYLRQGITEWIEGWAQSGWRTRNGEAVKNKRLWHLLYDLTQRHTVTWHWLKGHAGHLHNERADRLATQARAALRTPSLPSAGPPEPKEPDVEIYVKASYHQPQQIGGWGVVLRKQDHVRTLSGQERGMSANAMLIRAATEGLKALTRPCSVTVYSDADYLIRGASQWIKGWVARGWLTRDGSPVANRAEWESLLEAAGPHGVSWQLRHPDDVAELAQAGELAAEAAAGTHPAQPAQAPPD